MFTRTELESKTIQELRDLCRRYGLKPTGNAGYKTSYVTSLIAFPAIALNQMKEGRGIKKLSFEAFQNIGAALDQMNDPTDEQAALIKLTMEERRLHAPQSWEQQTLINLYKAKQKLEEVMYLLTQVASYKIRLVKWCQKGNKIPSRNKNGREDAKRNNYCLCYHR